MAFHEVQFPTDISRGSEGGPERLTDVVTLRSGFEERNTIWANSLHSYDAGLGLRDMADVYLVKEFFEARKGRLHGFRWKDWSDYRSASPVTPITPLDQSIGTGAGVATQFQLKKTYTSGGETYTRDIKKPRQGTVRIAVATVEKTEGVDFTVNYATGVVTFSAAPTGAITAGFEFDVPVRFADDKLNINVELFSAGSLPAIKIQEIRV